MNKISQFIRNYLPTLLLLAPLCVHAQKNQHVHADLRGVDRKMMEADSLDQPNRAIELSVALFALAQKSGNEPLQFKALNYEVNNRMRLNIKEQNSYLDTFLQKTRLLSSAEYKAIGILFYLDNELTPYSLQNDSSYLKKRHELSEELLKLLPQCKNSPISDFSYLLVINSLTKSIAPTLDLYLAAAWLAEWQNKYSKLYEHFIAMLSNSTHAPAAMYGKYLTIGNNTRLDSDKNSALLKLISEYDAIPEVGILYNNLSYSSKKEEINNLESYINRFPKSFFTPLFTYRTTNLKAPFVALTLPAQTPENKQIPILIKNYQTNGITLKTSRQTLSDRIFYPLSFPADYKTDTLQICIPPLKAGTWNIGIDSLSHTLPLFVSNVANYRIGKNLYAVDFTTGTPVKEASVLFRTQDNHFTRKMTDGTLDMTTVKELQNNRQTLRYQVKKNNHFSATSRLYDYYNENQVKIPEQNFYQIISNKPLYRLGDSVQFKGWAWKATPFGIAVAEKQEVTIQLEDPNYKVIDSTRVKLDQFGTYSASLRIPTYGMNGAYRIKANILVGKDVENVYKSINVEAYQAPSFKISVNSAKNLYTHADSAQISGQAISFNGLPVANQTIHYQAYFVSALRFITPGYNFEMNGTTQTDANGNFQFNIPLSQVDSEPNRSLRCITSATLTNLNGETEKGMCTFFISDHPYNLEIRGNKTFDISDPDASFQIYAIDPMKNRIMTAGKWQLINSNKAIVKSGDWTAGQKFLPLLASSVKPGKYTLFCETSDRIRGQKEIIIFNSLSREIPVDTALMLIPGKNNTLFVGTSEKEIHARYIWKVGYNKTEEKWITIKKGLHSWTLPAIEKGHTAKLSLIAVKDQKIYKAEETIDNSITPDSLTLSISTFRDHLTPGTNETWNMSLSQNNKAVNSASVLAFMYDESLNSLNGFNPEIKIQLPSFDQRLYLQKGKCFDNNDLIYNKTYPLPNDTIWSVTNPSFRLRNNSLDRKGINVGVNVRSSAAIMPDSQDNQFDLSKKDVVENDWNANDPDATQVKTLRSDFTDCAFFYPHLPINNDGRVTFSFALPDLITTWRFVAIANNEKMEVGQIQQSFIAAKELMLQINEPRFLRQEDQTEIEATVSFLKPHSGAANVKMELIDPTTGNVIHSAEKMIKGSNQILKVKFPLNVPANSQSVILRMHASNDHFSDGEQYQIPVLSPDIELTQTLDLNTGSYSDTIFEWKNINKNELSDSQSVFRLELVKNPAWYSLNALSAIMDPCSVSASTLINAYFANTLGEVIARMNPDIENYLIEKAESPLVGKVDKTPWVNAQEQESKQIQQALLLFNPGQIEYLRNTAFSKLQQLQNSDGGFAWYPGMWSSVWQTLYVLQRMGELTELGVIEYGEREKIVQINALKFIDKYIADTYLNEVKNKTANKPLSQIQALTLYVRAMYRDIPLTTETLTGHKNWTTRASKSWIRNNLYTKALLANALFGYGFIHEAGQIVESILNYRVNSPVLGVEFPANETDELQTQIAIMRLMLHPQVNKPQLFEEMKKWLISQKQNQMWITGSATVDATYALTMQGHNVLKTKDTLSVMLGNKVLKSPNNMVLSQSISLSELLKANGQIRIINQNPLPVFGALYRTFRTPLKSVSSNTNGSLKIQKEIIQTTKGAFRIGEEVTIRLTVSSKDKLDFVEIHDQLAACYQPVDQKSGYTHNQIGYYKELTNEGINLFIESLPRGTTIFEYKVWINRPGSYQSGVARIQSVYNPKYVNYSSNSVLQVK